jgi:ketosteroid isomerase-like protein
VTLEERVERLEAEREIMRTIHDYSHAMDYGLDEVFADCWLEHAWLQWPGLPRFEGREAILGAFRDPSRAFAPERYTKHLVATPRIEVDGDRAAVSTYFGALLEVEGRPAMPCFGRYRDVLVRCDDGRWRFQERLAEQESPQIVAQSR